nr:restriction endonuclease subunit S [Cysteiniphilum sp. 19X3-34]
MGEVPEGWNNVSLKRCLLINPRKSEIASYTNFDCSFIPMEKLKTDVIKLDLVKSIKEVYEGYNYFRDGDILMAKVTPCFENSNIAIANDLYNGIGFGSSEIYTLRPLTDVSTRYLFYRLQESVFMIMSISEMTGVGGLKRIPQEYVANYIVSLPPLNEQTTIAKYLDQQTAKIDQLIENYQKLIALSKEKRTALITHCVTKGLDPTVKMKDSGVEWLGDVPEHWEIKNVKRFFRMITDPAPVNNDLELLSVYTDIGVKPRKDLEAKGNKATTTDGYWKVKKGDLIVNKLLAWMGAIGRSNYNGVTSPAYDILRPCKDTDSNYYHYLFRSNIVHQEFKRWSRGIMEMRLRLYFEELGNLPMPFPPKDEQTKIINVIEEQTIKIDQTIIKAEQAIELLKEKRTALITAVVTGKVDVRECV